jgi:2-methylcitrate dehydratase PrpD
LALGIEIQCRLSNMLLLPPAAANVSLYITGITGPVGTAVALGRLFKFDVQRMIWAIGLAATQAAGFRGTHGSMAGLVVPAFGARSGVLAALLARKGFTCSEHILEGGKGFVDIFSADADLNRAVEGLGTQFELLANAYKPYPAGIVVHPAIDACLDIAERLGNPADIRAVRLTVHPLTLTLADRRQPKDPIEAQVSLYHWAAAAFLRKTAGVAELRQDYIDDPQVAAMKARIEAVGDAALGRDEAQAEVMLADGTSLRSHVANARGSIARPMTDAELDAKFRSQANTVLAKEQTDELLRLCRQASRLSDVGKDIARVWGG